MVQQNPFLIPVPINHEHARELKTISDILDESQEALECVHQDLINSGVRTDTGRNGMSAEQVLRVVILKQMKDFSYEELAFHLADSQTYKSFCRFGIGESTPRKSALQNNISKLGTETLEMVNRLVLQWARREGIEDGATVRGDCTVVASNTHRPSDSTLLLDLVEVMTRLLKRASQLVGISWPDHTRRAKRRAIAIRTARKDKRRRLYRDLLTVMRNVVGYADSAIELLSWVPMDDLDEWGAAFLLEDELQRALAMARQVMDQTVRRVFDDEKVPASDKLLSVFEPHTDIIIKEGRKVEFGHKIVLTTGTSSLILDCQVLDGNPADVTLLDGLLERHIGLYGKAPKKAAFDGGFASKSNLATLKAAGVEDVAFHKKRGLRVEDMARNSWVYRKLVHFRAGVESAISFLKRGFGLGRCIWKGYESFKKYVSASILSYNLLVLARHRLE